ncbi:uncharacterized protein VP01_1986g2 [Puccinia sorghi]|uniref:Uncharacterized protein n=1 Tax=Puccinia sorghi TaxID=27349 RepID=A0A0L6VC59_9BASI|nr:uncharacterized protein VP01_1986g2 [Puccinia sorghi]
MSATVQSPVLHNSQCPPSSTNRQHSAYLASPLGTQTNTPRTLSIRFAPLPDPRASRANLPGGCGGSDVWWSREEKPDGTWGDYRLVVRRPNGEIVAIDDLAIGSSERTQALETYRRQQSNLAQQQASPTNNYPTTSDHHNQSNQNLNKAQPSCSKLPDQTSSQDESRFAKLLPPLVTQTSNPTSITPSLTPTGSSGPSLALTLTRTTSRESIHSNQSAGSSYRAGINSSLTRKFIEAMKKPLVRHSHRLTPTNSLPIDCDGLGDPQRGYPLCKSRSDEPTPSGSLLKAFHFGRLKKHPSAQLLRRTRSKDEASMRDSSQIPSDEPPTRRRSNYPPVAQRKAHIGGSRGGAGRITLTEEPDFVEWKPAAAATSPDSALSHRQDGGTGDDDGSGMAWLRKRKKEREERAQREEEERLRVLRNSSAMITSTTNAESQEVVNGLAADLSTGCDNLTSIFPIGEEDKLDEDRASTSSSISRSSILSRDGPQRSAGTRTSTSSTTESSKQSTADDEDLNEEELREEERLKLLALTQSPFVRGATEVYRDREHHQLVKKSSETPRPINQS